MNERLELADDIDYENVKAELTNHLAQNYAAKSLTCTYGDIALYLNKRFGIRIEPISAALANLLGDISVSEHEKGDPLLSVVVVNKDTAQAGSGFFKLAKELGRYTGSLNNKSEMDIFFVTELKRAFDLWKREFDQYDPEYEEYLRLKRKFEGES